MRVTLLCLFITVLTYTKSQTVFDRVEKPIRAESCDDCPSGNVRCTPSGSEFVCECPMDIPRVDSGATKLVDFFIPQGLKTSCAPGLWYAPNVIRGNPARKAFVEVRKLEHRPRQCRVYVDEQNELNADVKLSCVPGEFVLMQNKFGVYKCPFEEKSGKLFVHAYSTEAAISKIVNDDKSTFKVASTLLVDRQEEDGTSFYVIDNTMLIHGSSKQPAGATVSGFYCITEEPRQPEIPQTYANLANDLRSLESTMNSTYAVDTCKKCDDQTQECYADFHSRYCRCKSLYLHLTHTPEPHCANTPFRALPQVVSNPQEFITAKLAAHSMIHAPYFCELYVADWNAKNIDKRHFECAAGQFSYHKEVLGLYTCDSGRDKGYLFVHTRHTDNSTCLNDRSFHHSIGNKSYYLAMESTVEANPKKYPNGAFYSYDDRIWERSSKCLVIGLYCIIETDQSPRSSYDQNIPADLRVPKQQRSDYRIASTCDECFEGQECVFSEEIAKHECFCPEQKLSFFPMPTVDLNSEAKCKSTAFLGYEINYFPSYSKVLRPTTWEIVHERTKCEELANDSHHTETYGRMACFAGEFGRHPVHQGIYTCDFGPGKGYLFIQTRNIDQQKKCKNDRTIKLVSGAHSFILYKEKTARLEEIATPHFYYGNRGRLFLTNEGNCFVVGLYCMKKI